MPLLLYEARDNHKHLAKLKKKSRTPFKGKTESFNLKHIFSVFNYLINNFGAFLNGDWAFLNAILGLKSPNAMCPCPICIVLREQLLSNDSFAYRQPPTDATQSELSRRHKPLIVIDPTKVVPTRLHVFLGIGNRIIKDNHPKMYDNDAVKEQISKIKSKRAASNIGASVVHALNGPELRRWTKYKCGEQMFDATADENKNNRSVFILEQLLTDMQTY